MKAIKFGIISLALVASMAIAAVQPANAALSSSSLGDLIVTNGLFGNMSNRDLAGLIAVSNISGGGTLGTDGTVSDTGDLSNLIVLSGLFGGVNTRDLAGLIAVSNIIR